MKYSSLIKILLKKEKIHYNRMIKLFGEVENIGGKLIAFPIIFVLITFFHYCFAFMHTMFETFMYIFNRERFNINVKRLQRTL